MIGTKGAKPDPENVAVEFDDGEIVMDCPVNSLGHNVVGTNSNG